jgi:type I restriction enzyme S subunit
MKISNKRVLIDPILCPTLPEQRKIVAFLDAVDDKITAVDQQIEQMEAFKKGLLQQMFV